MSTKPSLLHIIPHHNFVPPKNGGAQRCYQLCKALSQQFDLTVLTWQDKSSLQPYLPHAKIVNPPQLHKNQSSLQRLTKAIYYRWLMKCIKVKTQQIILEGNEAMRSGALEEHYDFILIEFLFAIDFGKIVKKHFPKAIRIANLHNVDHLLYQQQMDLTVTKQRKDYDFLKNKELHLSDYVECFLACSQQDHDILKQLNKGTLKGFVVPNGTVIPEVDVSLKDYGQPSLIFCGHLGYTPNKNGLLWFYHEVWPQLKSRIPDIQLKVVGRHSNNDWVKTLEMDPQIHVTGEVTSLTPYYETSNIAIVPLREGSGTRLKVLEAMAYGNPVVSTSIGAEGIAHTHKKDIIIADDPKVFAQTIEDLFQQPAILKELAKNAHKLVKETYDWQLIGANLAKNLKSLL